MSKESWKKYAQEKFITDMTGAAWVGNRNMPIGASQLVGRNSEAIPFSLWSGNISCHEFFFTAPWKVEWHKTMTGVTIAETRLAAGMRRHFDEEKSGRISFVQVGIVRVNGISIRQTMVTGEKNRTTTHRKRPLRESKADFQILNCGLRGFPKTGFRSIFCFVIVFAMIFGWREISFHVS